MTRLLSMDTSTTSTGCAVYEDGELMDTYLIRAEGKGDERLKDMIRQIYEVMEREWPDIVVVETPSLVRNAQTQRSLCMLTGAILGNCIVMGNNLEKDVYFHQYRPTEWRKQVKGEETLPRKRAELKEWAINKVEKDYEQKVNDDVAEAILIGKAYITEFSN